MASSTHLPADARTVAEPVNALGERLRALRTQRQLTIAQVATATGVTKPHISSIEKGGHRPSAKLLAKLEDFYDLTPGELFPAIGQQRPALSAVSPTAPAPPLGESPTTPNADIGGIVDYREGLTTNMLASAIHNTTHAIDILDVWLAENVRRLEGPFLDAAKRGVRVRIMLLHPELEAQRMALLGGRAGVAEVVNENIHALQTWYPEMQRQWERHWQGRSEKNPHEPWICLQAYLLPIMPGIQYHRYDDQAYVGFFLHVEPARQAPQLLVQLRRPGAPDARTNLGRSFWDEFLYLWQVLEKVPEATVPLPTPPQAWEMPAFVPLRNAVLTAMQHHKVHPHRVRPHEET